MLSVKITTVLIVMLVTIWHYSGGHWKECDPAANGCRWRWSSLSEWEDWYQVWCGPFLHIFTSRSHFHRMRRLTSGVVWTFVHIFTAISLPVQELHRGDEAAWSIRLSAQPALEMSREGCIYGSSRNMHPCISEIGNQEQALGIWQISYHRIAKERLKSFSSFPFTNLPW